MATSRLLPVRALAAALLALAPPTGAAPRQTAEERAAAIWVQDELRAFADERELRRYLLDVRRAARSRGRWWALRESERAGMIVVTGSRIVPRNASITNVQEAGVDEGDVVKQIGRFLVVLQDGRLFSIDTRAGAGAELALVGRRDVYRTVREGDWYDEILVRGDRILVTGYSYDLEVSELDMFRLTPEGALEREGIFQMASDDYYDPTNYATRIVGDNLILYAPLNLASQNVRGRIRLPGFRPVDPGAAGPRPEQSGRPLYEARSVYAPLLPTLDPVVHSVSICPLRRIGQGGETSCRTRAFIGPRARNLYVSPTHVYLWVGPDDRDAELPGGTCAPGYRAAYGEAERAVVYRMPVAGGDPEAVAVRGSPFDQFSLDEAGATLRALVEWRAVHCDESDGDTVHLAYVSVPLSRFASRAAQAPPSDFVALPPTSDADVANRFTETHLAYAQLREAAVEEVNGPRHRYSVVPRPTRLVVVPLARPQAPHFIALTHNVRRLEVAGEDLLVAGEDPAGRGTTLSLVDLAQGPRLASSLHLGGRFDGEGRSHAFNLRLEPDGTGLFGLPTIARPDPDVDDPWWSVPSDISFFSLDAAGTIRPVGTLASSMRRYQYDGGEEHLADGEADEDIVPGYSCEVSCVDWYGNSRPIFTDARIFALSAAELIEGRLENGRVVEVRRLDFARARPSVRAASARAG